MDRLEFGRDYIIPKPFDSRVLVWEAAAVAEAAMRSGVAQQPVDLALYKDQLERRMGKVREIMRMMIHKAQRKPMRLVFPEGEAPKILRACHILLDEHIAQPILLGRASVSRKRASKRLHLDLAGLYDHRSRKFARFRPLRLRVL